MTDEHRLQTLGESSGGFMKRQRVVLLDSHIGHPGEHGEIVTRTGAVFNGWTVRLDSGTVCGVGASQMRHERENERGY